MKRLQFLGVVQRYDKSINTYWDILFPYVEVNRNPIFGVFPTGKFAQIMSIPNHNFEGTKGRSLTMIWNAPYGHIVDRTLMYNVNNYFG